MEPENFKKLKGKLFYKADDIGGVKLKLTHFTSDTVAVMIPIDGDIEDENVELEVNIDDFENIYVLAK